MFTTSNMKIRKEAKTETIVAVISMETDKLIIMQIPNSHLHLIKPGIIGLLYVRNDMNLFEIQIQNERVISR